MNPSRDLCNRAEFSCQQYIARPNGGYHLIDLYFPQFNISVEIDEPHHEKEKPKIRDVARTDDIVAVMACDERRLHIKAKENSCMSLEEVNKWVDLLIAELKEKKAAAGSDFLAWDYEGKHRPEKHIQRGFIDVRYKVAFENHRDALRCFGYTKGHYQGAVWKVPSRASLVWFPKFYENTSWSNSLSCDGKVITEVYKGNDPKYFNSEKSKNTRIVFAHDKDALGYTLYRFLGEFQFDPSTCTYNLRQYRLVNDRINLTEFHT